MSFRQVVSRNPVIGEKALDSRSIPNAFGMGMTEKVFIKNYFVYILCNKRNGTLYTGVTSDLIKRIYEHKNNLVDGFTKKYNVHSLVWYEIYESAEAAINREKQIKKWKRKWKLELIEKNNLAWNDLYDDFCEKACPELDSGTGFLLPQE